MKKATFDTNTIKDTVVLSDTQFFQMFRTYEKSAWRLELLPNYMMKVDTNYHDYLSGKILPGNLNKEWWLCNENWGGVIKENLINNRTMARVRLVPEAVTSYFRYEVEWGYCYNALYGDDIRFLEQEKLTPKLRDILQEDFWLFDDNKVVICDYDEDGEWEQSRLIKDQSFVKHCIEIREITVSNSIELKTFLVNYRTGKYK